MRAERLSAQGSERRWRRGPVRLRARLRPRRDRRRARHAVRPARRRDSRADARAAPRPAAGGRDRDGAARRPRSTRRRSCSTSSATPRAPPEAPRAVARPVRHGHRHRSRQDRAERLPARGDARGRRGRARLQARADRPRRPAAAGVARRRRAARDAPRGSTAHRCLAAALRPARLPAPRRRARRRDDRPGAAPRAHAGGDRRRRARAVVEGVGGLLVPLSESYLVRDLAVELGLPLLVAARPGLGTINHTLLTLEAARAAGLEVRAVVLTPWPSQPEAIERSNRETIARLGAVEVATLRALAGPAARGAGARRAPSCRGAGGSPSPARAVRRLTAAAACRAPCFSSLIREVGRGKLRFSSRGNGMLRADDRAPARAGRAARAARRALALWTGAGGGRPGAARAPVGNHRPRLPARGDHGRRGPDDRLAQRNPRPAHRHLDDRTLQLGAPRRRHELLAEIRHPRHLRLLLHRPSDDEGRRDGARDPGGKGPAPRPRAPLRGRRSASRWPARACGRCCRRRRRAAAPSRRSRARS